jgi:aryl-alcohol dehydrogenase-like predicted oxidoreductase
METRTLGAGGLQVSKLSLGAMSFGSGFTRVTKIDDDLAQRLVDTALDAGVNLIDTADTYGGSLGRSEEVLGRVLRGRRDKVLLATKVGYADLGPNFLTYENVVASCEASLRRLDTDHIDLYQLHRADRTVPLDDTVRALEDLVDRGLVRQIGVSNYHAWEIARSVATQRTRGRPAFTSVQVYYSLVGRDLEHELLPYCRADDIGVLVYSAMGGGLLTSWQDTGSAKGRRVIGAFPPVEPDVLEAARTAIDAISTARGVSMAQVALAWVMQQPGVTTVIAGPSKVEQLEDNIAAADLVLEADELTRLGEVAEPANLYPAFVDRKRGFTEPT